MRRNVLLLFLLLFFIADTFAGLNTVSRTCIKARKEFPPIFYAFEAKDAGKFKVYVKVKHNNYVLFNVVHEVVPKHYKNLWRLKDSYMCEYTNGEMEIKYPVLTAGENEFVWFSDRPGVTEATGGFHGNERVDVDEKCFVKFLADNKEVVLDKDISLTSASTFRYIQYSTMHETGTDGLIYSPSYKPVEGFPIECYHEKTTIFKNKGFATKNNLLWVREVPVDRVYYGIFCVTKEISKFGYNDTRNKKPNIIKFNEDGTFKLKSEHPRIVMYNEEKNIRVVCDSKVVKGGPFELNTTVRDHDFYHKYYSAIDNKLPILTSKGEIWKMEGSISFSLTD